MIKLDKVEKERIRLKALISAIIIILFIIDYPFIDKALRTVFSDYEVGIVERVIDGDTIEVNGTSVRLLGINTPEKGDLYYSEAKQFLENLTLNRFVRMEKGKEDRDLYKRKLRYIILEERNINRELIENGFANFYFPEGKDKNYPSFKEAWEMCLDKNINLCEKSNATCAECIKLEKLDPESQEVILTNKCSFSCQLEGWTIKDEGRKVFTFPYVNIYKSVSIKVGVGIDDDASLFWDNEEYVWTETGDSLFLRDDEGKLVLWSGY